MATLRRVTRVLLERVLAALCAKRSKHIGCAVVQKKRTPNVHSLNLAIEKKCAVHPCMDFFDKSRQITA